MKLVVAALAAGFARAARGGAVRRRRRLQNGSPSNSTSASTSTSASVCAASCATDASTGEEVCRFTTTVDLFAGELGYYRFEECGDVTNPVLGLEVGKTYQFVQKDPSNYYHPLGFAYFADGAHADADELEPGIVPPGSSSACASNMTCPAPMYFIGDDYKGSYSNNPALAAATTDEDNFGLDDYEPLFFYPLPEWMSYGEFSVYLKFDEDTNFKQDIFYFCHIHQFMTGRIKLLRNGVPLQKDADLPVIDYEYDQPATHDQVCGTYGIHDFQLPHDQCPEKFVCDVAVDNQDIAQFSNCIDSMNCAMMNGMTSSVEGSESEDALFLHQMIPHHQNAVNMAKALLKTGKVQCDNLMDEESDQADDCALEIILREIINNQNAQIQVMRGLLDSKGYPATNDCKVQINRLLDRSLLDASDEDDSMSMSYSMSMGHSMSMSMPASSSTASSNVLPNELDESSVSMSMPASPPTAPSDVPPNQLDGICKATCTTDAETGKEACKFTAKVNLFAGELGYYQFEECGDATNPTLGLEVGTTYEFVQKDRSNYYHPLGLAYYPDGAHDDVDELEPGIAPPGSSSTCAVDLTCPAPMYYIGEKYQGSYSNNPDLAPLTTDEEDFGLDAIEPLFFHPLPDWIGYGDFSMFLKFDKDTDFRKDIFYFCHIHQFMTGRIKLLREGEPLQPDADLPELPYEYDQPAEHDQVCGTYGVHDFQLPHNECPEQFVCNVPAENAGLVQFSTCVESMNCAMMIGMTTSVEGSESEVALFLHQMIPHHQNAVNMAKALLKTGTVECDNLADEESEQANDCSLEIISREIINNQNAQIQVMRSLLDSMSYPEENDCEVQMSGPGGPPSELVQSTTVVSTSQDSDEASMPASSESEDTASVNGNPNNEDTSLVTTTTTPDASSAVLKTTAAVAIVLSSALWSCYGI